MPGAVLTAVYRHRNVSAEVIKEGEERLKGAIRAFWAQLSSALGEGEDPMAVLKFAVM